MAKLAILGHATRGDEVIEILEMMGGVNAHNLYGDKNYAYYTIDSDKEIKGGIYIFDNEDLLSFTIEEFEEKFPYKIGDKVYNIIANKNQTITSLVWVSQENEVAYQTNNNDYVYVNYLQPYKEAPVYLNEKSNKQAEEIEKILKPVKEIMEEIKLDIPDGYEFFGIDDDNKVVLTKKQPQYPKTYVECCKVLDIQSDWHLTFELNNPASCDLCVKNEFEYVCKLEAFRKILICRDAYWKIAGERMGLGEPWKPDRSDYKNLNT